MQTSLNNIWKESQRLSRKERMKLLEKLIHQLRIEDERKRNYLHGKRCMELEREFGKLIPKNM